MDDGALHREIVLIDRLKTELNFKKITRAALGAFWLLYETDCTIYFPRSNIVDKIAIPECERLARVYTLEGIDRDNESLAPSEVAETLRVKMRPLSDRDGRARTECVDGALLLTDVYISEELHERVFRPNMEDLHLVELDLGDIRDLDREHLPSPWNAVAEERDAEVPLFELDEDDLATPASAVANVGESSDLETRAPSEPSNLRRDGDIVIEHSPSASSHFSHLSADAEAVAHSETASARPRKRRRRADANPDASPAMSCVAYVKKKYGIVMDEEAENTPEKTASAKSKYMSSRWIECGGHLDMIICRSCGRGQGCNLKALNHISFNSPAAVDRDDKKRAEHVMNMHDKYYLDPRQKPTRKAWTPRQDPYLSVYAKIRAAP
ncbi:hypothetical protein CYMTET_2536 [Cymbomonas tetramitiformis]|uniref:Uncharacterized protein n=1 Tax=Cymbomonas tetramitiformis TaxID=36881 RepID=A0AAE0H534_9CHLO|nr:hypothetical protein CYMTET_2536 [Cymbomonas tetramitiformis]